MYSQRRGLASATIPSDSEARNTNYSLMHQKRRQLLEAQLQEKMELLKQYTNPRGIGMRGQTVPQRDVEMLQQQIAGIQQQLEALNNPQGQQHQQQQQSQVLPSPHAQRAQQWSEPPTPHSTASAPASNIGMRRGGSDIMQPTVTPSAGLAGRGGAVVSQPPPSTNPFGAVPSGGFGLATPGSAPALSLGSAGRQPPQYGGASGVSSSVGGGQTKREIVWQRKYELWLQRGGGSGGGSTAGSVVGSSRAPVPPLGQIGGGPIDIFQQAQHSRGGGAASAVSAATSHGFTPPTVNNVQSNPFASQQPQQQQQVMYGRRATPPTQGMVMAANAPQQQQGMVSNRSMPGGYGAPQAQQQQQQQQPQFGRRATPNSTTGTRPW